MGEIQSGVGSAGVPLGVRAGIAAVTLLACTTVNAGTLKVCKSGCTYSTVQSAVDAAVPGDTINVGVGTYYENVRIPAKSLKIIGVGEDNTVIDGQYRGAVLTAGPSTANLYLQGLTFTHGTIGIDINSIAAFTLKNSIVTSNRNTTGVSVVGEINSETVGGIHVFADTSDISGSVISHNESVNGPGGILVDGSSPTTIEKSSVVRNSGLFGGGILEIFSTSLVITDSTVGDNTAIQDGGGILVLAGGFHQPPGVLNLQRCSIVDNHAGQDGGGISGNVSAGDTVIARNDAKRNGGGVSGELTSGNSYVVLNTAGAKGGGVYGNFITVEGDSQVVGNSPDDVVASH